METTATHGTVLAMPLSKYIDHTLLKPQATEAQIAVLCQQAKDYDFASVCVNSCYAALAASLLKGSGVKTCCVVGFPLGAMLSGAKAFEAAAAVDAGAQEIDTVMNVGALKSGKLELVRSDIQAVVDAVRGKALVKVIIETCLLTDAEKVTACTLAREAGASFVKTSTGFSTGGASVEDVALMRKTVGDSMGVKASGGIHTLEECLAMIRAGANRIGASAGVQIMSEYNR